MAPPPSTATRSSPSLADFEASARALGAVERDSWRDFTREGRSFSSRWLPPGKSSPPGVEIITPAGPVGQPQEDDGSTTTAKSPSMGPFRDAPARRIASPAPLALRLETSVDRAGKSLRLNRETQTGDAEFDARIYLESEASDAVVLALLTDPALRAGVVKCLELGCTAVTLDVEGNLRVSRRLPHAELIEVAQLTPLLEALGAAAEAIPPLVAPRRARSFAASLPRYAFFGTLAGWPLYYLANGLWEPVGSDLYYTSVVLGIALWIVSLPILFVVLRGRAVSLRDFVVCAILLAIGLPLDVNDAMLTLNGLLDSSETVVHPTRSIRLRRTSGKSTTYYLTVASWHPGEATIEMEIGTRLFFSLAEQMDITVTTRRGFLGWERLIEIAPVAAPPPQIPPLTAPQMSN